MEAEYQVRIGSPHSKRTGPVRTGRISAPGLVSHIPGPPWLFVYYSH